MENFYFGAKIEGCSGEEIIYCKTRSTANRVRRVTRAYVKAGHFSGARTLRALADLAANSKYNSTTSIIEKFTNFPAWRSIINIIQPATATVKINKKRRKK